MVNKQLIINKLDRAEAGTLVALNDVGVSLVKFARSFPMGSSTGNCGLAGEHLRGIDQYAAASTEFHILAISTTTSGEIVP